MITMEDAKRAVQNAYTPQAWFLIVLKTGGWSTNTTRIGEHIKLTDDHSLQLSLRAGDNIGFAIADASPVKYGMNYRWHTESVSMQTQPFVLDKVVIDLLKKSGCIGEDADDR